jgi:hypothetical protein
LYEGLQLWLEVNGHRDTVSLTVMVVNFMVAEIFGFGMRFKPEPLIVTSKSRDVILTMRSVPSILKRSFHISTRRRKRINRFARPLFPGG